jgi:hypothetical protein
LFSPAGLSGNDPRRGFPFPVGVDDPVVQRAVCVRREVLDGAGAVGILENPEHHLLHVILLVPLGSLLDEPPHETDEIEPLAGEELAEPCPAKWVSLRSFTLITLSYEVPPPLLLHPDGRIPSFSERSP